MLIKQIISGDYGRANDPIVDILVIGGGATGSGVALDAVTRGLTTACIEKFDFASGTSSRSTKLIHGGVRYLQKAIFNLDKEQYHMVKEALQERANLLDIAPHLATPLPIMLPVYKLWQLPYYWAGIKMYDIVSGKQILKASYMLTKTKALENFPLLRKDSLVGALVYYDGQHDDARMCLSVALTAIRYGAKALNYTECLELTKGPPHDYKGDPKDAPQVITGARVRDRITGREYNIKARVVVNATGPYTDAIRRMDDQSIPKICQPSSGVHIVLPGYYSPVKMGLLDPATKDGRVIFFLPWMRGSLAGTTDTPCDVTDSPAPLESEVNFILDEIRSYLSPDIKVRRGDVMAAWSGIRPLVRDPNSPNTQSIARNHIIEVSPSGLVTIAGGKWTTYRSMAQETVDEVIKVGKLSPEKAESQTLNLLLEGAHGYSPNLFIQLVQEYGIEVEVAQHLTSTYGDKAQKIAQHCQLTGLRWPLLGKRLHPEFPYLEAEVRWACREYACRAVDFVARRSRLSFLNMHAAREALPRIVEIMGDELNWDAKRRRDEQAHAI
ncbi:glycerol-3-phosphate dehydrogenase, partial [Cichlidogyrus casuarinus]